MRWSSKYSSKIYATLAKVIWIILGVLLTVSAIVALVVFIKNRKVINEITDEKKEYSVN